MKLFLDNIRGFNNCFIDINQVNFLVGENSTGKSSFLSILSLFSDPQFNFSGEFKNSFVNFGLFEDIVNKNSSNQTTFSIGLVNNGKSALLGRHFNYDSLFLIFNEKDGYPSINTIICRAKTSCLKTKFLSDKIKYFLYSIKSSNDYPYEKFFLDLIENEELANKNLLDKGIVNIKGIPEEYISFIVRRIGDLPFIFPSLHI